jgi:hypothetical protein
LTTDAAAGLKRGTGKDADIVLIPQPYVINLWLTWIFRINASIIATDIIAGRKTQMIL